LMPIQVDGAVPLAYSVLTNDDWSESTITWANQPTETGETITNYSSYALGTSVVLDMTSVIANQATNDGLLTIRITQPNNNATRIDFCSKECAVVNWRPVLQYAQLANTAPVLQPIADRTIGAGMTLRITNTATDSDVPAQALTFSLLSGPTNAVINAATGVLTWRPLTSQANTTNTFTVVVTDHGTPSMSATQSFVVTVAPLARPVVSATSVAGQILLQVNGESGPDVEIQVSTNLINWTTVILTNSPAMPFVWTNSTTDSLMNFFRVVVGPPF
jgi:hypothetical protein